MTLLSKRQKRYKNILKWSGYTLLLIMILPLIPYAINAIPSAGADQVSVSGKPIKIPDPAAQLWRDVRQREQAVIGSTQATGVDRGVLINKDGEEWRIYRMKQLLPFATILLVVVIAGILLFHFVRGKVPIPGGTSGKIIFRFSLNERMVHWFSAVVFLLLGATGLVLLYGRFVLIPVLGPGGFSITASACKEIHNLFGPLFIVAIIALFITFVKSNGFGASDLNWFARLGGLFGGHASSGRFNAGEKTWFWLAIILGLALCTTGVILDFTVWGQGRNLIALSHVIHSLSAIVMIVVSFGHIYLGTAGMEGSLSAMSNGYVDANWAKAHHDLWYEEVKDTAVDENSLPGAGASVDSLKAQRNT